jgi:hypothetical protein
MKDLTIIIGTNETKTTKVADNFRNRWIMETEDEQGIHPKLVVIPTQEVTTDTSEYIKVMTKNSNTPLFHLQGAKALQIKTLEDFLRGYYKQTMGVKWL